MAMTVDAGLSDYPMGDEPEDNLRRMFADMRRVAIARRHLDDALGGGRLHVIAVDLDRSAVVRRRGVREKRLLVIQLHELIGRCLPSGATFLDSGSRDEGWIVLTDADAGAASRLAEEIRVRIAGNDFRLADGVVVRLTASLGIVSSPMHGTTGADLLWSAGEALWHAKRERNVVYAADRPIPVEPRSVATTAEQQRSLADLARRTGRPIESLLHEALQLLLENHAPRWHWIVDRAGPTAGAPAGPVGAR
jgi:GGDEF domain-containing protein